MDWLVDTVVTFICYHVPWVVIALAALMALARNKESWPLRIQFVGAGAYFVFLVGQSIVIHTLSWLEWYKLETAAGYVFRFLLFVGLVAFAAGYCWEKFKQKGPAAAGGFPVEAKKVD